jgi:hypothetical protein
MAGALTIIIVAAALTILADCTPTRWRRRLYRSRHLAELERWYDDTYTIMYQRPATPGTYSQRVYAERVAKRVPIEFTTLEGQLWALRWEREMRRIWDDASLEA